MSPRDPVPIAVDEPEPQWSCKVEQSVLGAALTDPDAIEAAAQVLSDGTAFYDPSHRTIWTTVAALHAASKPVDVVTVFERLREGGRDIAVGGLAYLNALAQSVTSGANAQRWAEIVADRHVGRQLVAVAGRMQAVAADRTLSIAERVEQMTAEVTAVARGQQRKVPQRLDALLLTALDRYQSRADGKADDVWPTHVPGLDKRLNGGLRPGRVYVVAGRPGGGKSSVARAIACGVAGDGRTTLLLSQEMPGDEVTDALLSAAGRVDSERLSAGDLDSEGCTRLADAVESLRDLPIFIDDEGGLTPAAIRAKARGVPGLKVLALDYLQLSSSTLGAQATTNDRVAEVSKAMKALALELGIAVVVLSQLNRSVETRPGGEPHMADLRDSGAIEQDADVIVMLWPLEAAEGAEPRKVGWKLAKHRGGRLSAWPMRWLPAVNEWRITEEPMRDSSTPRRPGAGL